MNSWKVALITMVMFVGCNSILPKPDPIVVSVPASNNYEAIMAMEIALVTTDTEVTPTPNKIKEGDKCTNCVNGKITKDGVPTDDCWMCLGDGIANKNDPILTNPGEYVVTIFGEMVDGINEGLKQVPGKKDPQACLPIPSTKPEENGVITDPPVSPRKQYTEVVHYYIYKDKDYYFWNDRLHSFISKSGVTIPTPTVADISSTQYVTICYGSHCLRHDIYKLVSQVEVKQDDQPRATERVEDGASKK